MQEHSLPSSSDRCAVGPRGTSMVRPSARWLGCATLIFVLCWPLAAEAWNPLRSAANGIARAGRAVGNYVGGKLGGFVERATAPSIRNIEKTGHALLDD